jgi:isocitrate/isopropylmalate dehydrogenase
MIGQGLPDLRSGLLSSEYPTITLNPLRVDTFSSFFPRRHKEFHLVATPNLFGDILSDQASGLAGGVGLALSLNAGSGHAMAQAFTAQHRILPARVSPILRH